MENSSGPDKVEWASPTSKPAAVTVVDPAKKRMRRGRPDISDASQRPGWWLASDGNWYPPQSAALLSSAVMPPPSSLTQPTAAPPIAPPRAAPLSPKEAKAEAKAAKARAKALRPWYRKKRFVLLLAIVAIIVIVIASSLNKSSNKPSTSASTVAGVDNGVGARNASGDISAVTLRAPDSLGFRAVTLTVTNHSSKRSNYLIELSIESPDGKTQYDTSFATVSNLEPGQTATPDAFPVTKKVPDDAVVKLKSVQRLAA